MRGVPTRRTGIPGSIGGFHEPASPLPDLALRVTWLMASGTRGNTVADAAQEADWECHYPRQPRCAIVVIVRQVA
jgi:hypothetical protein